MANELRAAASPGSTINGFIINGSGNFYNGTGTEPYNETNYGNYVVPMTEFGTSGIYYADFPSLGAGSNFTFIYKAQQGGSPDPTDPIVGFGSYTIPGDTNASSLLITGTGSGNDVDAFIFDENGFVWNGTSLVTYSDASYPTFPVTAVEQGTSGIYIAQFPATLTSGGPFTIFYKVRTGTNPDPSDTVIGTGSFTLQSESSASDSDEMSGSDWLSYVLLDFIRTDKDALIFAATKDTIDDIRRRIPTEDYETERTITDSIISLGDYAMDLETNFGIIVSEIVLMDTSRGTPLEKISKAEYDRRYRRYGTGQTVRGVPEAFCIFGGQILVGPVPDALYVYKISYTTDNHATITSATVAVPYTDKYREIIKFGVLWRVYKSAKNDDQAAQYGTLYESYLRHWEKREDRNRTGTVVTRYRGI